MEHIPLGLLLLALGLLIVLSAGFSGSETALMTLNRYRLRHLARSGHKGAQRASRLLQRPDRLIGLVLLGNNFVNILASSLATVIALRLWGEAGIGIAAGLLTLVVLIFAEVTPKTLAAVHPERIAFPAAWVYIPLMKILYPLVWLVNTISNALLRSIGVNPARAGETILSKEELRSVVLEPGLLIPQRRRQMLLSILDLEKAKVDDIMIPRGDIIGLDWDLGEDEIPHQLAEIPYTRIPVYEGTINHVLGFLHARKALHILRQEDWTREQLRAQIRPPYFVPEGTPLNTQLLNFQRERRRVALVVDEYGDVQGLATLEDILEEIVGEFTTDPSAQLEDIHPQEDGSYLVEGAANLRELNRKLGWKLPGHGPRTLNGLIVEHLEDIPSPGTSIRIGDYAIEILQSQDNMVKVARVLPIPDKEGVKGPTEARPADNDETR